QCCRPAALRNLEYVERRRISGVTSILVIECGVAETRAALIDHDRVRRLWFGPARGDEALDDSPSAGRRFAGRVKTVNRGLNAAFVDIGDGRDSYLPLTRKNEAFLVEGALIAVAVKSPPRQDKGATLRFVSQDALGASDPRRLPPYQDAPLETVEMIGGEAETVIIDDGAGAAILKGSAIDAEVQHESHTKTLFEHYGVEAVLETAFDPVAPIPGGGRLIIEEAQALTAIDVDTAGLSASSPARLREKIAIAAAEEAARQIQIRNIGGHIVIDFPSISSERARARFRTALEQAMAVIEGAGAFGFSKSGLYCFTAPHHLQSLSERWTETATGVPVAGRLFTVEWLAKSAIRKLEHGLARAPNSRFTLALGAALDSFLTDHPQWTDRLSNRYGPRFELLPASRVEERCFDLIEQ
ncbi:MAG: ribonuclease E/G, partial [Hyphococcus sp.]